MSAWLRDERCSSGCGLKLRVLCLGFKIYGFGFRAYVLRGCSRCRSITDQRKSDLEIQPAELD